VRLARFGEVAGFLARRARAQPIAILLDDLHAADPASLQLLEYVLPLLLGTRVLFALAARDSECTPEVSGALGRIQRSARRLPLNRLDRQQVGQLVAARADHQRVFELSEGNPLFVEELVASARAEGLLRLPALSSVRAVIRGRIAALPEAARAGLLAGSVVGRDFSGRVVADMLGTDALGSRLAAAQSLGMIAMTGPDHYRFSHALVAEAIADELDTSERARLHLRAAQALERCEPGESSAIAHHLLAAGHLAAEAAVVAAERAARDCLAQLAFENAAALLDRALSALRLAAPDDARRHGHLLCARAEALQHASRHAEAAQLCDQALAVVRGRADDDARLELARIALVRGLEFRFGMTDPRLVELLHEALAALDGARTAAAHGGGADAALRAKLLARLAAAEQPAPDPLGPVARALEAIAVARALPARDRLDVMYVASSALVEYHPAEQLELIHLEVLNLARGVDRSISVHTRLRLCFCALERIDRPAFDAALQVFSSEASALGLPRWLRQAHMLQALRALLEGRWDDAQRAAAQSEEIANALADDSALWILQIHRMFVDWLKTEPPDAQRAALIVADYARGRGAVNGWIAMQHGDRNSAQRALAALGQRLPIDADFACMIASYDRELGCARHARPERLASRSATR
jgi:hypothetical protein